MNREEAKELFRKDKNAYGYANAPMTKIDEIYDDFESRTCENCKYYYLDGAPNLYICNILPIEGELLDDNGFIVRGFFYPEKDFGCNKFERKSDDN